MKKYFSDPSLLFLLAANFYCIWYYQNHRDGFATIVWIYWFQSIIIGLFNVIDLYTIKNYDSANMKLNGEPITAKNEGCLALFFMVHYGIFHVVYAIFLMVQQGIDVNGSVLLTVIAGFLVEGIISFRQRKQMEKYISLNIGVMFFLPYLRIIPMHLMILGPVFLGWEASTIFLVLKTIADILSYFLYRRIFSKQYTD